VIRATVWLRRLAVALLLALLAAAVLVARVIGDGEEQMRQSDAAFDRGDVRSAAQHARRAAVLYVPGAPHVDAAYARLLAIAAGAEAAGQRETAQVAWRAMRGAALETRHLFIPRAALLEQANKNLARLSGSEVAPAAPGPAATRARRGLERDHAPVGSWVIVWIVGFALAASGFVAMALGGVSREGAVSAWRARAGIAISLLGVACWTLAVLRA
jgi:hypothetical protein